MAIHSLGPKFRKESTFGHKHSDLSIVNASHDSGLESSNKESSEIMALEHLSYINACARMELLNANSKLINYHVLKKNSKALNKPKNADSNKSMDFSLSFRSDFNINNKFNKSRRGTKNENRDGSKANKIL